jgi:hypothetical protein
LIKKQGMHPGWPSLQAPSLETSACSLLIVPDVWERIKVMMYLDK